MANIILHSEHRIASHYLPAIINDDWTGLEDFEAKELAAWLIANVPAGAMLTDDGEQSESFTRCEISGPFASTVTLQVWIQK